MFPKSSASTHLAVFALLSVALGAGCAGGKLKKPDELTQLPKDLPKEIHDKFEVKEAVPEPSPSPVPAERPSKKRKKQKTAQPKATSKAVEPVPAAVIYPNRRPAHDPIWPGEKQVFEITYFGMSAGDFSAEVLPYKSINNRKVYHVRGTAESSKVFGLFYRLNDMVETYFDFEGIFSHRFHIELDESKQTRDSLELNDSEKAQTYFWNRWNRKDAGYTETKEFSPMPTFPQDSFSAMYYLRTVPLPTGAVITFPVVSEGKSWEAVVTVLRREEMSTPLGKKQVVVLRPETKYQGILKKQGDSFLYMTDDDRRYTVRLEAKVKIGTVIANLKEVQPGSPPEADPSPTITPVASPLPPQ